MDGQTKTLIQLNAPQVFYLWRLVWLCQIAAHTHQQSTKPATSESKPLQRKKSTEQDCSKKKSFVTNCCVKGKVSSVRRSTSGVPILLAAGEGFTGGLGNYNTFKSYDWRIEGFFNKPITEWEKILGLPRPKIKDAEILMPLDVQIVERTIGEHERIRLYEADILELTGLVVGRWRPTDKTIDLATGNIRQEYGVRGCAGVCLNGWITQENPSVIWQPGGSAEWNWQSNEF